MMGTLYDLTDDERESLNQLKLPYAHAELGERILTLGIRIGERRERKRVEKIVGVHIVQPSVAGVAPIAAAAETYKPASSGEDGR